MIYQRYIILCQPETRLKPFMLSQQFDHVNLMDENCNLLNSLGAKGDNS